FGRSRHHQDVVDVRIWNLAVHLGPGVASIGAVPDAVHLEPDPHLPVVGGIYRDPGWPRDADVPAVLGDVYGEMLPALPTVGGAIDARLAWRAHAREQHARINGVDSHAPDHGSTHWRVQQAPLCATVIGAVEAQGGARVDHAGRAEVAQQRLDDAVGMHALAHAGPRPVLAVVGAH